MEQTPSASKNTPGRTLAALAFSGLLLIGLAGCDAAAAGGSAERVRLVLTPVPTPTQTQAAAPTVAPVTYTVKAGDTLWDIANLFGVTLDDIVRANNIADPSSLSEGQVLTVPIRPPTSTPGPASADGTASPGTAQPSGSPTVAPGASVTVIPLSPTLPPPDATPPQGPPGGGPTEGSDQAPGPTNSPTIIP
ncbi:MAG TPA: LysM peptidoglycan-binding domain-containing protein [Chloroflexia bacterium]|nr:LysM peptidoglycan-binding domain-containing protein [Chloroflexia bacterium]